MTDEKNGGPVHPHPGLGDPRFKVRKGDEGMNLRDWFAGQALACVYQRFDNGSDPSSEDIAMQAYLIADAMLVEREETRL